MYDIAGRAENQPVALFETRTSDDQNSQALLFLRPHAILETRSLDEVESHLTELDRFVRDGYYAAGYLTYEAGYVFEPSLRRLMADRIFDDPLVWFGIFKEPIRVDFRDEDARACDISFDGDPGYGRVSVRDNGMTKSEYKNKVQRIMEYIGQGDTYQINLTWNNQLGIPESLFGLYQALKQKQKVQCASYICHDEKTVISLSPELFFQRTGDRIQTRPMKGTAHRGRNLKEDEQFARWLHASKKNRAENIMIVDLLRNDLGRICETGSVRVSDLFTVERYNTLFQMTSSIEGTLRPDIAYRDIFKNIFPCGSVTGAPKIRSMEIIHELEKSPRGIYTGAIGYISPRDEAMFNVAIRTAVFEHGRGRYGIGSGIVWDSDAETEFAECELKQRFLEKKNIQFSLIETMLFRHNAIRLFSSHLERLAESAVYFDFICDLSAIEQEINRYTGTLTGEEPYKIRLLLHRDGTTAITHEVIPHRKSGQPRRVALSRTRTNSADTFLFHKTTNRGLYNDVFHTARKHGLYDVIFTNERGEITEGCINNVFLKLDGEYVTPPINCGLLTGVMRRHILSRVSAMQERPVTVDDLKRAETIMLSNSVRGLRRVELIASPDDEDGLA